MKHFLSYTFIFSMLLTLMFVYFFSPSVSTNPLFYIILLLLLILLIIRKVKRKA